MGRYVLRRLLQLIPVFFGTTFLIYILVWAVPGDPFAGKCGDRRCPDAYVDVHDREVPPGPERLRPVLPLHAATCCAVTSARRSAAGRSSDIIANVLSRPRSSWRSSRIVIEGVIGITAGVLTGLRRNGFLDNLVLVSTLFLIAVPVFVTGFVLQWLLGVQWGIINPTVSAERPLVRADHPGLRPGQRRRWPSSPG